MKALLTEQTFSQRTWPAVGDIDDCWVLAWMQCQDAVAPWYPLLDATQARRYAGDPDDGRDDGNDRGLYDMERGIKAATPALSILCRTARGMPWATLLELIKSGRPLAAAVMGGSLPKVYTRVGHQVTLFHEPGVGLRVADPMAPDRSEPYRISTPAAAAALASFAGTGLGTGILFPTVAQAFTTHPLYVAPNAGKYTQAQLDAAVMAAQRTTAAPLEAELAMLRKAADELAAL